MNPPFPPHQPPNLYNLLPPQVMQQPVPQMLPAGMAAGAISSANSTYCYMTKRMLGESDSARAKRLAKNAERMRQKRAAAAGIPYQPKPINAQDVPLVQQQQSTPLDLPLNTPPPPSGATQQQNQQQYNSTIHQPVPVSAAPGTTNSTPVKMTKLQMAGETEEQRVRRLAKNAERMRQKRAAQAAAAYQQPNSNPPTQVNPGYAMPTPSTSVQLPPNLYAVPVQLHQIVQPVPGPALPGGGQMQPLPQLQQAPQQAPAPRPSGPVLLTKCQLRLLNETPEQRATRLAKNAERMRQKRAAMTFEEYKDLLIKNAERMRQKRANKSYEEYKLQLAKNAEANRRRRQNETPEERAVRHMRNAMRQRLRRAMETPEQKAVRKARLAERMRHIRANETPEQRKIRLAKGAERARNKFLSETPEERAERNRKKAEYARVFRSPQQKQRRSTAMEQQQQPAGDGIKAELVSTNSNSSQQLPQHSAQVAATPSGSSYAINYSDFGAAFPVALFNHPQIKNGAQQGGYNPAYPMQPYYPELSVPTPAPYAPKGSKSQSQHQQQQQQQPGTSKGKR